MREGDNALKAALEGLEDKRAVSNVRPRGGRLCAIVLGVLFAMTAAQVLAQAGSELIVRSEIPSDFFSPRVGPARDLKGLQQDFDVYSWETFIAINWPATAAGTPDESRKIGDGTAGDYLAVWESWRSVDTVFPPQKEATPDPIWEHKGTPVLTPEEPFDTGPLIDRNGRYALFDILMNQEMFEFIIKNSLYTTEGQQKYSKKVGNVVFPCGAFKIDSNNPQIDPSKNRLMDQRTGRPLNDSTGSILIKAGWRQLSAKEVESGRYFMRRLATADGPTPTQGTKVLGLVGLHIVHKSEDVPEWNWSTFEQVDNVPTAGTTFAHSGNSFFNDTGSTLPINAPPPPPWNANETEPTSRRSRIVRQVPASDDTTKLNDKAHALLRKINSSTVWQYYDLISTQWPTRPARVLNVKTPSGEIRKNPDSCNVAKISPNDIPGGPAPVYLANSTTESYIQGRIPNTSSSCMECHANATTTDGGFSDFTYILARAHASAARATGE
jgi:hypothetical protein